MPNPLHEQLLKAGLVKKSKVAAATRELNRQRQGKAPAPDADAVDARRLQAERAERDRALAAERNALARQKELQAQIRQIVQTRAVPQGGDIAYRFVDGHAIRTVYVDAALRAQLARGAVVIVAHGDGYALLPRAVADMVRERGGTVVLDHGAASAHGDAGTGDADDPRFRVPDDLVW
ncbi:DUF2058 domain-containing protein [Chiayiivirga flava]|uniref:DUF2058 domain-containing protein n=1 Tax=Chiayiivirga flava TaxID=659595 RepID=A0A7W8D2Y4_9GAMM|nr:DUF2058 domain-containing protein [Chiayiivirga flava]MBB5206879.1 hypothetical protein [Chiayiivirga flava]